MGIFPTGKRLNHSDWCGVCPSNAPFEIDNTCQNGDWGPDDFKKASKWNYIAPERESAEALFNIGTMHRFGYGTKAMDKTVAAQYFHKAAEKGHVESMYWIGYMYHTGEGLPKNCNRAVEWFQRAAAQGDATARKWLSANMS